MKLTILVLAAGASRRFNGCKLLAPVRETTSLLRNAVHVALSSKLGPVTVLTGAWHGQIADAQNAKALPQVPLCFHSNWQQGLGTSIAFGVGQLPQDCDAVLIMLADQPNVSAADLRTLVTHAAPEHIVCSEYLDQVGVPALFPRAYFSQLAMLNGDKGAKALLINPQNKVVKVSMASAALDIDTRAQLAKFTAEARCPVA